MTNQRDACWGTRTFRLDGVLVENIDQLIFAARLPIFGVVASVILQKGKINTLLILQRQRFDMLQKFVGQMEVTGAQPVGAQLHSALHPHEALVLSVQERTIKKHRCIWFAHVELALVAQFCC